MKEEPKPMFEEFADDVKLAVEQVVEKYKEKIKKRKCSPHLVGYWIDEGANRAKYHIGKTKN